MTPYGARKLGQHWHRWWLVAWRHQAITWTNVDLSSVRSGDIVLRAISQQVSQPSITVIGLKKYSSKISLKSPWPQRVKAILASLCYDDDDDHNNTNSDNESRKMPLICAQVPAWRYCWVVVFSYQLINCPFNSWHQGYNVPSFPFTGSKVPTVPMNER